MVATLGFEELHAETLVTFWTVPLLFSAVAVKDCVSPLGTGALGGRCEKID
jgi:hypothetical protein